MKSASLEKQINIYLPQLTVNQKKAVLTVAKTFVEQPAVNPIEYSKEFKKELDSRYAEYISGGKLISEKEASQRIKKIINGKSKG